MCLANCRLTWSSLLSHCNTVHSKAISFVSDVPSLAIKYTWVQATASYIHFQQRQKKKKSQNKLSLCFQCKRFFEMPSRHCPFPLLNLTSDQPVICLIMKRKKENYRIKLYLSPTFWEVESKVHLNTLCYAMTTKSINLGFCETPTESDTHQN